MGNELMNLKGGKLGIKRITSERVFHPKSFRECGRFSFSETVKEYIAGSGIVVRHIEHEVFYDCMHRAHPDNFGGLCMHGSCVCRDCIEFCEVCGGYLCLIPGCCNPVIFDGRIICNEHLERPRFLGIF